MKKEKPLVNNKYLLEKYPGKGGWTYAAIPEIIQNKNSPFGWVKVKGFIDDYEINSYKLMPMGIGKLFLPVKAEIRKKISKEEGDWINVILYLDNSKIKIPKEFQLCLYENKISRKNFSKLSEGQKKEYLDWIYSAKAENTKFERILKTLNNLEQNKKFRDI